MSDGCGIGSVLLRPDRIRRAAVDDGLTGLAQDVVALVARLGADRAQGGVLLVTAEQALEGTASRLLATAGGGLDRARHRLQDALQPVLNAAQAVAALDLSDPLKVAEAATGALAGVAEGLKAVSIDSVRGAVGTFMAVIEEDLGLGPTVIEDHLWAFCDDLIARFEALPTEADPGAHHTRVMAISVLRRLKAHMKGTFTLPWFDSEDITQAAMEQLRRWGADDAFPRVVCIGDGASKALTAVDAVLEAVPFTGFGSHSVGAGEALPSPDKYLWYPSWLLGKDVWVGGGKVMRSDKVLFDGTEMHWDAIPAEDPEDPNLRYTFRIPADAMEILTWVFTWAADYANAVMHIPNMRPGETLSDALLLTLDTTEATLELAGQIPWKFVLEFQAGLGDNAGTKILSLTPRILALLGGSLQGIHTKATFWNSFKFWFILLATDVMNLPQYPAMFRDLLLTIFTLINYDGPFSGPGPDNRRKIDAFLSLSQFVHLFILAKIYPRDDYAFVGVEGKFGGHSARLLFLWDLLAASGFGFLSALMGTLLAGAFSRSFDWDDFPKNMGIAIGESAGLFLPLLYSTKENDTDGGKWSPTGNPFAGYPKKETSPYKLPYEKDKAVMCVQGNLGFFSHNYVNPVPQVYSYDLALDQEDEVLAARGGVVADYFDWVPDDTKDWVHTPDADKGFLVTDQTDYQSWNFIVIRHDTPVADHDKDQQGADKKGAATTTYGVYGHGRFGSVRKAFHDRGIEPMGIIGTHVDQGQVIMLAGNTGHSLHNHLHIEVRPEPAPATPPPPGGKAKTFFRRLSDTGRTLPFVFNEPSLDKDGVPKTRTFYTSTNEKKT